jgi:uncharacterized protein YbbC (DUF1343 family)
MKIFSHILLLSFLFTTISCSQNKKLETGADLLLPEYLSALKNKNIGLVTNSTGVLSNGTPIYKGLLNHGLKATLIFAPEHGFGINAPAGQKVNNSTTAYDSIKVYSLYGSTKKPTKEMLKNVEVLIYDIQDLGTRFYTYISTLFYVLQAAAENNIPVYVLDRPDPLNGITIDGPVLKEDQKSFVGIAPLPIQYGMTPGELALYFSGEGLLGKNLKADIKIIKMKNWKRDSYFDDYYTKWTKTSPNIPDFETALVYPGTCFIEGTNISEGRGTFKPFLTIGAPFINSLNLINILKEIGTEGLALNPVQFTPVSIPGMSENPKYMNQTCSGISIKVTDRNKFKSVEFGIKLIYALRELYPDKFQLTDYFNKLTGDISVHTEIMDGTKPDKIIKSWHKELKSFNKIRKKYLLY